MGQEKGARIVDIYPEDAYTTIVHGRTVGNYPLPIKSKYNPLNGS